MIQVTKVWWDGEKLMAEPIDPTTIYQEPAQQEPIAEQQEFSCNVCSNKSDSEGVLEHGSGCYVMQPEGGGSEFIADAIPQPAQRTWVGLNDGEKSEIVFELFSDGKAASKAMYLLNVHEAKLKEKNT